jgi:hypothetical protein
MIALLSAELDQPVVKVAWTLQSQTRLHCLLMLALLTLLWRIAWRLSGVALQAFDLGLEALRLRLARAGESELQGGTAVTLALPEPQAPERLPDLDYLQSLAPELSLELPRPQAALR